MRALALALFAVGCHAVAPVALAPKVPEAPVVARVDPQGFAPPVGPRDGSVRSRAIAALGPKAVTSPGLAAPSTQPFVHFARPMQPEPAALHFELAPHVPGTTVWVDPYRAYFVPDISLELGRRYEVHVHGRVHRDDGSAVDLDERWSFATRPPTVALELHAGPTQWWDGGADASGEGGNDMPTAHWRVGLEVGSEERTTAAALRPHVSARAWPIGASPQQARPVEVKVVAGTKGHGLPAGLEYLERHTIHIHPRNHWPAGHVVEVTIDERFAPAGAGPIGEAVTRRFRVVAGAEVTVSCGEDFGDGCGPGGINVAFAAPMAERDRKRLRISPRPKDFAVHDLGEQHVWLTGDFVIGRTYTVTLAKGMRDRVGQPLVGDVERAVAFVPPPPAVELVATGGVLRPTLPATVGLESRWVRKALLRAAVPSERAWIELQRGVLADAPFPTDVTGLIEREVDLDPAGRYAWSSQALDLAALAGGQRPLLVEVVPLEVLDVARHRRPPTPSRGLFQVTSHGLAVWTSPSTSRIQVRDNSTLAPTAELAIELRDREGRVVERRRTDTKGFAELPSDRALPEYAVVVARSPAGYALAQIGEAKPTEPNHWRDDGEDRWRSEVVTERALYRPGETVSVVGWAAVSTARTPHGLLRPKAGAPVELELIDHRGDVVARRRVAITRHGKYWGRLNLPEQAALGRYTARAKLPQRGRGLAAIAEATFEAGFEVRDVEVPEFEVRTAVTDANLVRGQGAEIVTHASYYFGGAVPIANHRAVTDCSRAYASVPGLDGRWALARVEARDDPWRWQLETTPTLGPTGEVRHTVATAALTAGVDVVCDTDVSVQDASFSEVGGSAHWFVHPSRYVAVQAHAAVDHHDFDVRAVEHDGETRVVQPFELTFARLEQKRDADDNLVDVPVTVRKCKADTTAQGADARCASGRLKVGRYLATLTTTIDGRAAKVEQSFWISPPPTYVADSEPTSLVMRVEPTAPKPGDRVKVSLRAPKVSGPGVLAFSHIGLRQLIPFELEAGKAELVLDATDAWVPSVELDAFVVTPGSGPREPPRTWHDRAWLAMDHDHRRLEVDIDAPKLASAGDELPITVRVRGRDGGAPTGRVAIWAVDEGLHAMVPPRIPDFVASFAQGRPLHGRFFETFSDVLRPYVVRDDPFEGGSYGGGYGTGSGSGSGAGGMGGRGVAVKQSVRRRFEGTPIFIGDAPLERGVAVVKGRMPDNLTTFRITAIASAEVEAGPGLGRFGHADARVQVTAPLVVRPAFPRMLRPGDEAELAVLVDNLGGGDGELTLAVDIIRGADAIEIIRAPQATANISAGAQTRFPFVVRARKAAEVELELRAELAGATPVGDAVRTILPIERADLLRRHAAVYGSSEQGPFAVALTHPRDLPAGSLAIDVELSGTMLGDLQGLARDLVQYPYGCVEQTSSGLLPLAALKGLSAQGYLDVDVREHIDVGIARLRGMQVDGGGFAYWPGSGRVHVWGTAYALWVLEQVHAAGHPVPETLRHGLRDDLLRRLPDGDDATDSDGRGLDDVAASMAVHALVTAGAKPRTSIARLFAARGELPTFARALLLLAAHGLEPEGTMAKTLHRELRGEIDEREGAASVRPGTTYYDEYFDSSARTDALVTLALQRVDPDDALLEKLVRGLALRRGQGSVANTQERAYTMLALAEYARHREKATPALDARVWFGATATPAATLRGRTPAPVRRVGTVALARDEDAPRVTIERKGQGRLYYRVGMSWTPEHAGRTADAHGLALSRSLRTAGGRDRPITAGELVAMDVTLTVDRMQRYLAIDLPLPPGLEAVDTTLGKGARARALPGGRSSWVSHQELRRDRAVVFADALPPGEHTTTIMLRATAAGSFEMPPAVAHAMYMPETRGHTARARVEVAARP